MSLLLVEWSIKMKRSGIGISGGDVMVHMMLISSTEPTIIKGWVMGNGYVPASAVTLQRVGSTLSHSEACM